MKNEQDRFELLKNENLKEKSKVSKNTSTKKKIFDDDT